MVLSVLWSEVGGRIAALWLRSKCGHGKAHASADAQGAITVSPESLINDQCKFYSAYSEDAVSRLDESESNAPGD